MFAQSNGGGTEPKERLHNKKQRCVYMCFEFNVNWPPTCQRTNWLKHFHLQILTKSAKTRLKLPFFLCQRGLTKSLVHPVHAKYSEMTIATLIMIWCVPSLCMFTPRIMTPCVLLVFMSCIIFAYMLQDVLHVRYKLCKSFRSCARQLEVVHVS